MAGISMDNQHRASRIFGLAKPTMQMGSVLRRKVNVLVTQVFRFPISNRIFGWKKQRFVDTRRSARSIHLREGQEKCSKQEGSKYWYRYEFPFHGCRSITLPGWFGGIKNCNLSGSGGEDRLSVVLSRLRVECVCRFYHAKNCVSNRLSTGQDDFNLFRHRTWMANRTAV